MPIEESPNLPQGDKDMEEIMANKNNLTVGEIKSIIKWLEENIRTEKRALEKAVELKFLDEETEIAERIEEIRTLIDRLEQQQIQ